MNKFKAWYANNKVTNTVVLVILTALWSMPTVGLLVTAIRSKDLATNTGWWDFFLNPLNQSLTLDPWVHALDPGYGDMLASLLNTAAITIPATILPLLVAANAAYAFTFIEFKGKEIYFAILIALMVIPLQSSLLPVLKGMVAIQKALGIQLTGSYTSAWIVHCAFALPLAIYLLRNYMMTLPFSVVEAARIDGASPFQIFWRLIFPMTAPALASFAIFQFLWVWNDYLIAFIFVGEQKPVMTYKLLRLLGQYGDGWQDVAAGAFISMIVPLIVFFSLQRYFIRGLTAGSVK